MKKVLVINVENCCDCPLCYTDNSYYGDGHDFCGCNHTEVSMFKLSPNCPLKNLPSKLESPNYAHESYYHYNKGWNDLLDEIENQK